MKEEEEDSGWLKALIISLSINLLKLLKLWDSCHQELYCPFLCQYPVAPPRRLKSSVQQQLLKYL